MPLRNLNVNASKLFIIFVFCLRCLCSVVVACLLVYFLFLILMLSIYFCLFVDNISIPNIFIFGAFVHHFIHIICIFVTILCQITGVCILLIGKEFSNRFLSKTLTVKKNCPKKNFPKNQSFGIDLKL